MEKVADLHISIGAGSPSNRPTCHATAQKIQMLQMKSLTVPKFVKFKDFRKMYAKQSGIPTSRQIWWVWVQRQSGAYRPELCCRKGDDEKYLCDLREEAIAAGADLTPSSLNLSMLVSTVV